MTRGEFLRSAGALATLSVTGCAFDSVSESELVRRRFAALQAGVDEVTPEDFKAYLARQEEPTNWLGVRQGKAALLQLDDAFEKVREEAQKTVVAKNPAVWFVYGMGIVVKTAESLFSVDLMHRHASELVPSLDFALVTHNDADHVTEAFRQAMLRSNKPVIGHFKGGKSAALTKIRDVEIHMGHADRSERLVDATTTFEIRIGKYVIYHTGDCCSAAKLNPSVQPDLWIANPCCGLKLAWGVRKFHPLLTAVGHLNELRRPRGKGRLTWQDGLRSAAEIESVGERAVVPVWGDRIV